MLRILGRRTSGNVMKPLWAADEMGLDYEQVDLGGKFGGNREPDYLAMNPMGLIPTLVEDDFVLWDRTRSPATSRRSMATARSTPPIRASAPSPTRGWTGSRPPARP